MLKIDLGCGAISRPDFIGVDIVGKPDILCDISSDKLPFHDRSVDHIFSAHCLEHIAHNDLYHVLLEMSRVAADNALIEIWHPHAFHGDSFVLGHVNALSEALYAGLNIFWKDFLGARWIIQEIRYHVEPHVLLDLEAVGLDPDFAICYMHDIVKEIGVLIRVDRGTSAAPVSYARFLCKDRVNTVLKLANGPRSTPLSLTGLRLMNGGTVNLSPAENSEETELARMAASSARWFEAVIAISPESDLLLPPPRRQRWRKRLARLIGGRRRLFLFALAERASDAGQRELAVRYYRDALELDPDDPEIWARWGHALKQAGKKSEGKLANQRSRELHARRAGW